MIPAFSVERTQELLFDLNLLVERDGVTLDRVYLDSPLGIGATHLYEKYREELDLKFPKGFVDDNFSISRPQHHRNRIRNQRRLTTRRHQRSSLPAPA